MIYQIWAILRVKNGSKFLRQFLKQTSSCGNAFTNLNDQIVPAVFGRNSGRLGH